METGVLESVEVPTTPGMPHGGGLYCGCIFIAAQAFALIVSPKSEGENEAIAWGPKKNIAGALSYNDGLINTQALASAGSSLGQWARDLRIAGRDDWYVPSRLESLIAFGELPSEFEKDWYWTSTQSASTDDYAWFQNFVNGYQDYYHKSNALRARAVRRVPV